MNKIVLFVLIFCVVGLLAHKEKDHKKEHEHHGKGKEKLCGFTTPDGTIYNFLPMQNKIDDDYVYSDNVTGFTILLRPCGRVHEPSCPKHSSICVLTGKDSLNFGHFNSVEWSSVPAPTQNTGAEGPTTDMIAYNTIEGTYGEGEVCTNGVPRKTIVQYTCNGMSDMVTKIVSSTVTDDCFLQVVVSSPYACPADMVCGTKTEKHECHKEEICVWNTTTSSCVAAPLSGCHGSHRFHATVFSVFFFTGIAVLLSCVLCVCLCAFRSRRLRAVRQATQKKVQRKVQKKVVKKKESKKGKNTIQIAYQPAGHPIQLIPGGFAPINPYSGNQGYYPMVTFVAPQNVEEQV